MAEIEKARANGPIPNAVVYHDSAEFKPITVALQGQPQGKGRARAFIRGGHVGHYTPEKTRTYEGMIRTAAMQEIGNNPPLDGPIEFVLRAIFPVPASWSERKRQQAILGEIKPGKKPDLDNIAKAWNDALNGVAYRDDALICRMTLDKRYGPQALVVVTVSLIENHPDNRQRDRRHDVDDPLKTNDNSESDAVEHDENGVGGARS